MTHPFGFQLAKKYVCVSTVGPSPAHIRALEPLPARLAWSVHAADDKLRKYPMASTIPFAIESYGRLCRSARDWVQIAYHEEPERKQVFLNELAVMIQNHTASMILAAYGAPAAGRRPGDTRRTAARGA